MKKIIYFVMGCILVGVVISTIFGSLPVFPFVAKGFLMSISNQRYQQAYNMLSSNFQSRVNYESFISTVQKSGLDQYKDVKWYENVTAPDHKTGFIRGMITTKDNATFRIEFNFIQIQGTNWLDKGWRIDAINTPGLMPAEPEKNKEK